ncbi:MAG: DUF1295 domain-containing protein [Candidatus Saccharimonadales bacterium]
MPTYLLITFAVSLGLNLAMFLIAYRLGTDKLTDISYSLTFILLAAYGLITAPVTPYRVLILALVVIWGLRLGSFLFSRVLRKGRDSRFDDMRGDFPKFAGFWVLQGVTVWVVLIPALLALRTSHATISLLAWLGALIWATGVIVESIADYQKDRFSQNTANQGRYISSGIWSWSRHPNYFGEILVWVGVYLAAVTSLNAPAALIGLVSPLFITVLLLFVSGIPILEKNADAKWGSEPEYQNYKRRTSLLIPLPPK